MTADAPSPDNGAGNPRQTAQEARSGYGMPVERSHGADGATSAGKACRRGDSAELPGVRGNAADVTLTVDTFIAEVPIDPGRCILVYLRQHGGRQFVRWRVFHKHGKGGNWYPDKRRWFVVPVRCSGALAGAIAAAGQGQVLTDKPAWLEAVDRHRAALLPKLEELNAPPKYLNREKRRMARGWGMGPGPMPSLWHRGRRQ
jgi:hypothetical protein